MGVIFSHSAVLPKKSGHRVLRLELGILSWYAGPLASSPPPPLPERTIQKACCLKNVSGRWQSEWSGWWKVSTKSSMYCTFSHCSPLDQPHGLDVSGFISCLSYFFQQNASSRLEKGSMFTLTWCRQLNQYDQPEIQWSNLLARVESGLKPPLQYCPSTCQAVVPHSLCVCVCVCCVMSCTASIIWTPVDGSLNTRTTLPSFPTWKWRRTGATLEDMLGVSRPISTWECFLPNPV